jgi:hypothetical protein
LRNLNKKNDLPVDRCIIGLCGNIFEQYLSFFSTEAIYLEKHKKQYIKAFVIYEKKENSNATE